MPTKKITITVRENDLERFERVADMSLSDWLGVLDHAANAIPEYGEDVATKKITITLPEEALARVRELAAEAGLPLSTWVAKVLEHEARIQAGLAALREWDAEDGPLTEEELAAAEAVLAEADARAHARASRKKPGAAA